MVGDSIFPGQSTAAVALGGLRVGAAILDAAGVTVDRILPEPTMAVQSSAPTR